MVPEYVFSFLIAFWVTFLFSNLLKEESGGFTPIKHWVRAQFIWPLTFSVPRFSMLIFLFSSKAEFHSHSDVFSRQAMSSSKVFSRLFCSFLKWCNFNCLTLDYQEKCLQKQFIRNRKSNDIEVLSLVDNIVLFFGL